MIFTTTPFEFHSPFLYVTLSSFPGSRLVSNYSFDPNIKYAYLFPFCMLKLILMLFCVCDYLIFLSFLDSSFNRASKILLYCFPDLYLRKTGLSFLVTLFLAISKYLSFGLVFHAYSSLIIY